MCVKCRSLAWYEYDKYYEWSLQLQIQKYVSARNRQLICAQRDAKRELQASIALITGALDSHAKATNEVFIPQTQNNTQQQQIISKTNTIARLAPEMLCFSGNNLICYGHI